ncbi:hypothetical protein [Rhizobium sp. RAF56]|jgi:hypothetical protein
MQVRPWFVGLAMLVAAIAFSLALVVTMIQAPQRSMMPPLPQRAAQR